MWLKLIFIIAGIVIVGGSFFALRGNNTSLRNAFSNTVASWRTSGEKVTPVELGDTQPASLSDKESPAEIATATIGSPRNDIVEPSLSGRDALTQSLMVSAMDFAERYGNSVADGTWLERFRVLITDELQAKLAKVKPPVDQIVRAVSAHPTALAFTDGRAQFSVDVQKTVGGKITPAALSISYSKVGNRWVVNEVTWK